MASGTLTFNKSSKTSSGSYILGKIDYEYTQSDSDNSTTITCKVYVKKANDSTKLTATTNGTFKYSLTMNGETITGSKYLEILTSYKQIGSFTRTIEHNNDGSKSFDITGSVWLSSNSSSDYYNKKSSVDTTMTFPTFPRASSITSAANVTLDDKCSIKWIPLSSSFSYKIKLSCGGITWETDDYISPGSTSEYTFSRTMSVSYWASAIPDSYTGTCNAVLYTYRTKSEDSLIGSHSTSFVITLSKTITPIISVGVPNKVDAWTGPSGAVYCIQGKSKCQLSASFQAGQGSRIKSWSVEGEGISKSGSGNGKLDAEETGVLTKSGTIRYQAKATDGRCTVTKNFPPFIVEPYAAPTLSISAARIDNDGSKVKFTYKASCSSVNGENKLVTLKIYNKESTKDEWGITKKLDLTGLDSNSINNNIILNNYDATLSYDFKAIVTDACGTNYDITSVAAYASIPSEFRILNINAKKTGISFGKMAADDSEILDCQMPARFLNTVEFGNGENSTYGSLEVDYNTSGNNIVYIRNGQDVEDGERMGLAIHRASVYIPGELNDGKVNLGSGSRKWNQLYAASGTISTSDRRVKTDIENMSDTQEQLFNKLQPVTFKFTNGSNGRTHYGFISQDVEDSLDELSMTGQDFAGFCKDLRVDEYGNAILDENDNKVYNYSLRYSEFIALNTFMIQKLQAENAELRSELKELKEMIINPSSKNVE